MILLVLSFILLMGCQPAATPEPAPPPEEPAEGPIEEPVSETPTSTSDGQRTLIPIPEINIPDYPCVIPNTVTDVRSVPDNEGIYVDEQIILIGPQDQINLVVEDIDEIGDLLTGSDGEVEYRIALPNDPNGDQITMELRVLNLANNQTVWDVVELANATAVDADLLVFAEPNYITVTPIIGFPRGGGSGIVGDPLGTGLPAEDNGKILFINQWALSEERGIQLIDTNGDWNISNVYGSEIQVAVFDTVSEALQAGNQLIDWAYIPFDLCVWKPGLMLSGSDNELDYEDHGLFATGLAQIIAPAAHYTLVEVLNADAVGDLFTLLRAMDIYANSRWNSSAGSPLGDTVLNLSLGLEVEKRFVLADALSSYPALAELAVRLEDPQMDIPDYLRELAVDKFPVVSLKTALSIYDFHGAVIVAASGNDAKNEIQAPAAFSEVIGVASSNDEKDRSCFSNFGNVAAPGGEGGDGAGTCLKDLASLCAASPTDCEPLSVISLVHKDSNPLVVDPSGYAYWQGTSFSAPMVSGLTALTLESGSTQSSQDVRNVIYCSPGTGGSASATASKPLGAGVINVKEALTNCP
jgi:subtilisin family serine protease